MHEAAQKLEFERAAGIRDKILAIERRQLGPQALPNRDMSDSALSPSSVSVEEDRSFLKSLPEKPGIYIFKEPRWRRALRRQGLALEKPGAQLFRKKNRPGPLDSEDGGGIHPRWNTS